MTKKEIKAYTMNRIIRSITVVLFLLLVVSPRGYSEEYRYGDTKKIKNLKQTAADCAPASGFEYLDINNVRARINTGGDMWWDLDGISRYYIPKAGSATSVFAGALWIGGLDINNQLKLCGQRYRQVGIDFWTGPLKTDGTASIDESTCSEYDRFFDMDRAMVDDISTSRKRLLVPLLSMLYLTKSLIGLHMVTSRLDKVFILLRFTTLTGTVNTILKVVTSPTTT